MSVAILRPLGMGLSEHRGPRGPHHPMLKVGSNYLKIMNMVILCNFGIFRQTYMMGFPCFFFRICWYMSHVKILQIPHLSPRPGVRRRFAGAAAIPHHFRRLGLEKSLPHFGCAKN